MTTTIMRQLWSTIETTQAGTLLHLDDASLVQWLIKQTSQEVILNSQEIDFLADYIQARLNLIRDIADQL